MSIRIKTLSFVLLLTAVSDFGFAQNQKFPYKARVTAAEAYVRSGGGENFYPTQILKKDSVVTVRRHDPGGWYKIDPPEGSFSWIAVNQVRQTSKDTGIVTVAGAVVACGSQFGDETTVWSRSMLEGEEVRLLGQKIVETEAGPRRMYRIAPPARAYRWVSGADILPLDKQALAARDSDPYAVPSNVVEQQEQAAEQAPETAQSKTEPLKYTPSKSLARIQKIRKEKLALRELDREFRTMLMGSPSDWDLDEIESRYQKLQDSSTYPPLAGQIDLRYPAIGKYRIRKAEYEDFKRLTSETEKRDSELLAAQYGLPSTTSVPSTSVAMGPGGSGVVSSLSFDGLSSGPIGGTSPLTIPEISLAEANSFQSGVIAAPAVESPVNGLTNVATGNSAAADVGTSNTAEKERLAFVGAGFVQRGITSESEYVLMSPAGKVLAHLTPDQTVDLEEHIGQSVGVKGKRFFDESVETDRINVSGLQRVRLR